MAIWKTKWGYRAEFEFKGQRTIHKGFFQYKSEAREWIKAQKEERKKLLKAYSLADGLKLSVLYGKYLEDCKVNYIQNTYSEKKSVYKRFKKYVGDLEVIDITPQMVLNFLNHRAESLSNNAANSDRKNIKAFYGWVQEMYGVMYDPTGPIRKKPHTKKARRLIPIKDILRVILVAQGQDRILLETYWHTGARKSELYRLTWAEDINFEERWIRIGTRKSRSGEMVYEKLWMNDDLYKSLMWQWNNRVEESPYVFCHNNPKSKKFTKNKLYGKPFVARHKMLKVLCKKAGVEPFGFHDIRHTVAKYLNDLQKVNLKKVQQVLRHRKQTTTEIYVEGNYTDTKDVMKLLEMKNVENFF